MRSLVLCDEGKPGEALEIAAEQGLGLELQTFYHPDILDAPDQAIAEHVAALSGFRGMLSMHGPFGDLAPGSFDPKVRQVAEERILQFLRIAIQLGASDIVLHDGYVPNTSSPERWIARASEFWRDMLGEMPPNMHLHLENLFQQSPGMLLDLVDRIADPRLGICLDIGHVHAFSDEALTEWVEELDARITYTHLHDNVGDRDAHLALGQGSAPLTETLSELERRAPQASWAIEGPIAPSLEWLREGGFVA